MDKRAYFAAHCPEDEISRRMGGTVGEVRDGLIRRGIIPNDRRDINVMGSYNDREAARLRAVIRWEYADDMLENE